MQPTTYTTSTNDKERATQQQERSSQKMQIVKISQYLKSDVVKAAFQEVRDRAPVLTSPA